MKRFSKLTPFIHEAHNPPLISPVNDPANPPGDDAAATLAETKSADATASSRAVFKTGDYVTALKSVDEAPAEEAPAPPPPIPSEKLVGSLDGDPGLDFTKS